MATWKDLELELETWRGAGVTPTFWWRDDDTEEPTAELDRLLGLADRYQVPLHLSVVPAGLSDDLAAQLSLSRDVYVLQHGYAHINHEPQGARASEVGVNRDITLQIQDLQEGWQRLVEAELPNLLPVMVPPWNRIADETVAALPGLGYRMLSRAYPRQSAMPAAGLAQVNIHFDPVRWKEGARFRGEEKTLEILTNHLVERRLGKVDPTEPTGLSTHHLQSDEDVWDFVDSLLGRLAHRDAGDWVPLSSLIGTD